MIIQFIPPCNDDTTVYQLLEPDMAVNPREVDYQGFNFEIDVNTTVKWQWEELIEKKMKDQVGMTIWYFEFNIETTFCPLSSLENMHIAESM